MSALTRFQPKLTPGHLRYHIDDEKEIDQYIQCDGSIVLRETYPKLFDAIGARSDRDAVGTLVTSGTSNNINDLIYANNTFVYVANDGILATSSDAITWTQRNTNYNQPSYVGGKTLARAGGNQTALSLTDLTGGTSSAPVEGDVVFIAVSVGSNVSLSQAVSGYTQIASLYADDVMDTNLWVGYKRMGVTPDTTVTIPASLRPNDAQTVAIQVWRGLDGNNPFDVPSTTSTGINTILANPPAITTQTSNTVLLVIGAGCHYQGTQTYGASYLSNFLTTGADKAFDSVIGFGSIARPTAGTYDPAAFTFSSSNTSDFSWTAVTIALRDRRNINTLLYANNTFVYAGNGGVLATSPDAITWTQRTSGTSNNINALTYGNGTFVYAGNGGVLATSNDVITWTQRISGTSNNINALTYGNGTFVYAGDGGVLATSPDAITWTQRDSNILLSYVGGKTFARAGSTSTTNISLTDLTGGTSTAPVANDVVFIAVATGSIASRSQAVSDYTQIASLYANDNLDTNLWVGYKVMGTTPDTTVTIPASGSTLDAQTVAIQVWKNLNPSNIFDVTATTATSANTVLANPPAITTSTDDAVLLVIGAGGHDNGTQTYGASYLSNFLTIGADDTYDSTIGFGSIVRPTAGTYDPAAFTFSGTNSTNYSWAAVTIALRARNINALTYANNTFVYAGNDGTLATSNDAITWTQITFGTSNNINDLTYDTFAQNFAYVTNTGELKQLKNLNLDSTTSTTNNLNSVVYANGFFVYAGDNGTLGTFSEYTYDPNIEFLLPTSNNIFNETRFDSFTPKAYIKYE